MNKKVLVTGGDGFIGSHLVELLHRKGCRVRALALYNSFNHWGWLEDVDCRHEIEIVTGDVRDPNFCRSITKDIDWVFHLAALIAIPYSYTAPDSYVDANVRGTLNICRAALDAGCQRVLHTSTSEVYGTARRVPIDESHPLQPQSPYSASKIGADAMAMSFHLSFGLPLTIVRPFNTYGPRQSARAVIPTVITQIASGCERLHLGALSPTRDFNYVEDTCRGFWELANCPESHGLTVNIGSNTEISIGDTIALIQKIMNAKVEIVTDQNRLRPDKSEVERLRCDNSLIRRLTGYQPSVSLEEGLAQTVEWFKQPANLSKYKPDIFNL